MLTTQSMKPLYRHILALDFNQFDVSLHRISSESIKSAENPDFRRDLSCLYIKDKNGKTDYFVMLDLNVKKTVAGTTLTSGRYNHDTQILEIECFGNKELTDLFEFVKKFVDVKEYAPLVDTDDDTTIPYVKCYGYSCSQKSDGVGYTHQITSIQGQVFDLEEDHQFPSYGKKLNIAMSHRLFSENGYLNNTGPLSRDYNKALEYATLDIQKSLQKDIEKIERDLEMIDDKESDQAKAKMKELSELQLEYERNISTVVV